MITRNNFCRFFIIIYLVTGPFFVLAEESSSLDYMSFAQGALLVKIDESGEALKVNTESALRAIDGDHGGYVLTPKPGGPKTEITFIYRLPAATTFAMFAVPNVLETPSPSQTFFKDVEISGSMSGVDGPFAVLATTSLAKHKSKSMVTVMPAITQKPAIWIKLRLSGGIDIQREKTFFEFSEIIGYGAQDLVPLLDKFTGTWKGRGVLLELKQEANIVVGCYDGAGDLSGTVTGNILRATGKTSSGILSTFVLTLTDSDDITGVRSTNGAPFRIYTGASKPGLKTQCSVNKVRPPGCGAIVHGINFDYDSADIRPDSAALLDTLFVGLKDVKDTGIVIVGHTSSEGADAYNQELSLHRAQSVAKALVERGIEPTHIKAEGAGEDQPIAGNITETGRSLNRRVEVVCQ